MEQFNNLIAHYQDASSDKVYIASVRRNKGGNWEVVGAWGRRGKNMSQQIKLTTKSRARAHMEQNKLFNAKTKKGYRDVRSAMYNGPLRTDAAWMSPYLAPEGDPDEEVREPPQEPQVPTSTDPIAKVKDGEMFEVVCQNNTGYEAFFDRGIEYMAEKHRDDQMLWVYDKFAEKQEMFRERFEIVETMVIRMVKARG
jgi:predicted DNA-binding WGR domain protein